MAIAPVAAGVAPWAVSRVGADVAALSGAASREALRSEVAGPRPQPPDASAHAISHAAPALELPTTRLLSLGVATRRAY